MRLAGLASANACRSSHGRARLAKRQRADGRSPAQLPTLESDAYATGQTLYALQTAAQLGKDSLKELSVSCSGRGSGRRHGMSAAARIQSSRITSIPDFPTVVIS